MASQDSIGCRYVWCGETKRSSRGDERRSEGAKVNNVVVIGNEALGKKYGLDGMPLTALVGRDGKIADSHCGIVDKDATERKIQELLKEGGAR